MSTADQLRRCAEYYTDRMHWPVFPLHPIRPDGRCSGCGGEQCAGKHPIPNQWTRTIASLSAAQSSWRTKLGTRGIGLPCGAKAGVWVLDVDVATGGPETLVDLQAKHGPLPRTPRARTGSGGEHLFFTAADDSIHNSASQVAPGLDIRGTGGYVVLAPSPHRSGTDYQWVDPPTETPIAEAPGWLTTLALMRPRRIAASGQRSDESLNLISAGRRHDALVRFCGLLRSCGLGEDAIVECGFALLRHHAVSDPPMDLKQAEKDMRDVARRYPPTAPEATR